MWALNIFSILFCSFQNFLQWAYITLDIIRINYSLIKVMASSKESALAIKWGTPRPALGFLPGRLRMPHGPGKERPYLSTQHKVKDPENNGFFSQDEPQHKKCKHFWEEDVKKWKRPKTVDGWVNDKEEEVAPAGTSQGECHYSSFPAFSVERKPWERTKKSSKRCLETHLEGRYTRGECSS